mmetsp:Transcript_39688/g.58907  ORF Transcript_39688/g.58907 Transcript_39688/m.58907 type:complete len:82 (-) Transcript_39688:457-702(-)
MSPRLQISLAYLMPRGIAERIVAAGSANRGSGDQEVAYWNYSTKICQDGMSQMGRILVVCSMDADPFKVMFPLGKFRTRGT